MFILSSEAPLNLMQNGKDGESLAVYKVYFNRSVSKLSSPAETPNESNNSFTLMITENPQMEPWKWN